MDTEQKQPRVAVIYMCIGKYWKLFDVAYETAMKHLFPEAEKTFFVLTDHREQIRNEHNIITINKPFFKWPYAAMTRSRDIVGIAHIIRNYDYAVFINANVEFRRDVPLTILQGRKLFAVKHAYFTDVVLSWPYGQYKLENTTETRIMSNCCIHDYEMPYDYCFSGFTGGESKAFLAMHRALRLMLTDDEENGITPIWHDESALNRYILDYPERFTLLPPAYLCPEVFAEREKAYITLRDKTKELGDDYRNYVES